MMYFLTLLCTTLNSTLCAIFCCMTMKGKHKFLFTPLFSLCVPVVLISLDLAGISEITEGHILRSGIALSFSLFLTCFFFAEKLVKKIVIFCIGALFMQMSCLLIAVPLAKNGFFEASIPQTVITPNFLISQYLSLLGYGLILAFAVMIIRRKRSSYLEGWNLLFLFAIVQIILGISFSLETEPDLTSETTYQAIRLAVICTVADLAIFYVIGDVNKKAALEETTRFYKTQLVMQLALYENFSAYGQTLLQTKARITESLSQAQRSLRSRDYQAAETVLAALPDQLSRLRTVSYCENNIVNALLFIKHRQMEQAGISFAYQVQLENDCFAEQNDLCRILGNLLDNAIEACRKLPDGQTDQAKISLTCMSVKNTLLIQVENPFSAPLHFGKNGLPVSSKKKAGHGLGLAAVQEIAKKYGGALLFEKSNSHNEIITTVHLLTKY